MYPWIWRHLPGPLAVRVATAVLLFLVVAALLLFAVFPTLDGPDGLWNPTL
ncbi:hypothetical protein [Geodermatophilus sp. SYSU D01176]